MQQSWQVLQLLSLSIIYQHQFNLKIDLNSNFFCKDEIFFPMLNDFIRKASKKVSK